MDKIMKFKVSYGLGGGFSGSIEEEILEFKSIEHAQIYAYEKAIETYEMYEGLHGLRTVDEILEEENEDVDEDDKIDWDEAVRIYIEERDTWLDFSVEPLD
ncbi:MAG: hypothetical protein ACOC22_01730 [bacterium]